LKYLLIGHIKFDFSENACYPKVPSMFGVFYPTADISVMSEPGNILFACRNFFCLPTSLLCIDKHDFCNYSSLKKQRRLTQAE
jgi:hypothetical protein